MTTRFPSRTRLVQSLSLCAALTGTSVLAHAQAPSLSFSAQTNVACNGATNGAVTVTAAGGQTPYSYAWSNGDTTDAISGLAAGTYVVTVTGADLLQSTDSVVITEPALGTTVWLGTNSNWFNASNWSCGAVPDANTDALIDSSATVQIMPVIDSGTAIARNITLTNGGSITLNGDSLNVQGNVNGPGVIVSSGTMLFSGSGNQTVDGFNAQDIIVDKTSGTLAFAGAVRAGGDFTMNSPAGLSLGGTLKVGGDLTLTDGIIDAGNSDIFAAGVVGGSASSYINTSGTGTLRAPVPGSGSVTFPVGTTQYNPATLTNTGTTDSFSVRVFAGVTADGTPGGTPLVQSQYAHPDMTWLVDDIGNTGAVVDVTLQINEAQLDTANFDLDQAALAYYNTGQSNWEEYSSQVANMASAGVYTVAGVSISGFGSFTISSAAKGTAVPLPVTVSNLSAKAEGVYNRVAWHSEDEAGLVRYELEKSTDGKRFEQLQSITAQGKTSDYTAYDRTPAAGLNHYRLKLVRADGTHAYSATVQAFHEASAAFAMTAHPNPASNQVTVEALGTGTSGATIFLTDLTGKTLATATLESGRATLSLAGLPTGLYLVRYTDGVRQQVAKVSKQ